MIAAKRPAQPPDDMTTQGDMVLGSGQVTATIICTRAFGECGTKKTPSGVHQQQPLHSS